jgi:23S rRNA pseudouridine1911/1915/1917 synthase
MQISDIGLVSGEEEQDLNLLSEEADHGSEESDLYEHFTLTSAPGQMMLRLDVFLATFLKNTSRSRIKNATLAGNVFVNDQVRKASYKVKPGDKVSVLLPYPPPPELSPEQLDLTIHYEDDSILLVNKRPGMVVHPGVGNHTGTLVHGLLWHFNQLPKGNGKDEYLRPGLVHRIDKDTSGLIVIAKNEYALSWLARQFYDHSCERTYHAIVWGNLKEDKGTITGNIGRSLKDRKIFQVFSDPNEGKHAVTHYEVLERFGFATYVKCNLETGRTHQIRVHFKHIGHTLFSDSFYGGDSILAGTNTGKFKHMIQQALLLCPRQALHAKTLGFVHPDSEKWMAFDSEIPKDIQAALELFRQYPQS